MRAPKARTELRYPPRGVMRGGGAPSLTDLSSYGPYAGLAVSRRAAYCAAASRLLFTLTAPHHLIKDIIDTPRGSVIGKLLILNVL